MLERKPFRELLRTEKPVEKLPYEPETQRHGEWTVSVGLQLSVTDVMQGSLPSRSIDTAKEKALEDPIQRKLVAAGMGIFGSGFSGAGFWTR